MHVIRSVIKFCSTCAYIIFACKQALHFYHTDWLWLPYNKIDRIYAQCIYKGRAGGRLFGVVAFVSAIRLSHKSHIAQYLHIQIFMLRYRVISIMFAVSGFIYASLDPALDARPKSIAIEIIHRSEIGNRNFYKIYIYISCVLYGSIWIVQALNLRVKVQFWLEVCRRGIIQWNSTIFKGSERTRTTIRYCSSPALSIHSFMLKYS